MKTDIILSGVGGQGILTIAMLIGRAAIEANLHIKQSEVHGMAQRGGAVSAHLRISDQPIHSDLIPDGKADAVMGVEPMEALRYASALAPNGILITNKTPVININPYPAVEDLYAMVEQYPKHILIDADAIAKQLGQPHAMNIVMLGTLVPFLNIDEVLIRETIRNVFARKGEEVVAKNLEALAAGMNHQGNF